jgi:translation initiation factor IF-1
MARVAVGDRVAVVTWQWDERKERVIAVILSGDKCKIG